MNGPGLTEPTDESVVTDTIVGKAASCAVAHAVGVEMVFEMSAPMVSFVIFRLSYACHPELNSGYIRSGPKRKTRAITLQLDP